MTTESFCNFVWGLSYSKVKRGASKEEYQQFFLPKKNGHRTITYLPCKASLFSLQKQLVVFLEKQPLPDCVKGFRKGESYISYLEPHIGGKCFLRIDISNFFPSITDEGIKKEFDNVFSFQSKKDKEEVLDLLVDIVTYNGSLPQGACSSPVVSNCFMARADQRILKYCQTLGVTYTRYADDMLFSSDCFDFKTKKWFLKKIRYILATFHLKLNYGKIKMANKEISLSGYVISNGGIRLSRGRLLDIQHVLNFSKKSYMEARTSPDTFLAKANSLTLKHRDLSRYPFKSVFQFTQFLCGYRAFLIPFLDYNAEVQFAKKANKIVNQIESQLKKY